MWRIVINIWHLFLDIEASISIIIKIAGSSAMTVWLGEVIWYYSSLPTIIRVFFLLAVFCGSLLVISFVLKGLRIVNNLITNRMVKKIRKDIDIDNILKTVEAISVRYYCDFLEVKKRDIPTVDIKKVVNIRVWLYLMIIFTLSAKRGVGWIASLLDEHKLGIASTLSQDGVYEKLDKKLEQQLRLKNLDFRNDVYDSVRVLYGMYSMYLFMHLYKLVSTIPLFARLKIRESEDRRKQGVGNILVRLALKLGNRSI